MSARYCTIIHRRRERLEAMLTYIRSRGLVTAGELARYFEVTERTVYRDINTLVEAGAPIEGEPGLGYMLRPAHPVPIRFTTPTPLRELLRP